MLRATQTRFLSLCISVDADTYLKGDYELITTICIIPLTFFVISENQPFHYRLVGDTDSLYLILISPVRKEVEGASA